MVKKPEEKSPRLPRDGASRLILGGVSFFFALLLGLGALVVILTPLPSLGLFGAGTVFLLLELLITSTAILLLLTVWAVATPRWVDRVFEPAWTTLICAILLALLPIIALIGLATSGLTLGDLLIS